MKTSSIQIATDNSDTGMKSHPWAIVVCIVYIQCIQYIYIFLYMANRDKCIRILVYHQKLMDKYFKQSAPIK